MKPKGLQLFDQDDRGGGYNSPLRVGESYSEGGRAQHGHAVVGETFLDADQLDKLAERCKQWAKYLRVQKKAKPVPPKKWEDL